MVIITVGDHSCEYGSGNADTKAGDGGRKERLRKEKIRLWMETCFTMRCLKNKALKLFI